jgi:hypothetical protein
LQRSDLRRHFLELFSETIDYPAALASKRLELVSTSGTTEDRIQAVSDSTIARIPAHLREFWDLPSCSGVPRTAVLTSRTCLSAHCTLESSNRTARVVHDHTMFLPSVRDPFDITRSELEAILADWEWFDPTFVLVNPVYAHCLAQRARDLDCPLPRPREILSSYQYLSKAQERSLVELFGAPVFDVYSATELGGCQIGLDCRRGRLHMREDHCLVEFMDLTDPRFEASGGEIGAVVVSTLAGEAFPLIRYAVGDLGVRSGEACDCGMSDWPSFELHGRRRDAFRVADRRVITTKMLDDVVGPLPGVRFYQCRYLPDESLSVSIVREPDVRLDPSELERELRSLTNSRDVRIEIKTRLEPASSYKFPLLQSFAGV